jgi:hypothetical protein
MVSELGFSDALSLAQTIGIVGTMVLTLFFSKRQIEALSSDTETRALNDLDEKVQRMTEIVMADPSLLKVASGIEADDYPKSYGVSAKEVAFSFYLLSICNHAYTMRQRKVLDDNEWTGWLQRMRTCFQRGTMSQIWKHFHDGAFDPNFQKFLNTEIIGAKPL